MKTILTLALFTSFISIFSQTINKENRVEEKDIQTDIHFDETSSTSIISNNIPFEFSELSTAGFMEGTYVNIEKENSELVENTTLVSPNFENNAATLKVQIRRVWCDKTTEAGEDEIFFKVVYKGTDGTLNGRNPNGHYSINDGNNPRAIDNFTLIQNNFYNGSYGSAIIALFEEDGGTSAPYTQLGEEILSTCSDPYCVAGKSVLQVINKLGLKITDTDDYIGSFSIQYGFNPNGSFWWQVNGRERYSYVNKWGENGVEVKLNGDGSSYRIWLYWTN